MPLSVVCTGCHYSISLYSLFSPLYEELDLRHEFAHFSQENQQKLLPPELHSLTPVCTKSFVGWVSPQTPLGELTVLPQTP